MRTGFAAFLLFVTSCSSLQQPRSTADSELVSGSGIAHVIVETDGVRLPGVELRFESSAGICTEVTSASGEALAPLNPGTWKIAAVLPGFAIAQNIFTVAADQDARVHVHLTEQRVEAITIYEPPPAILDPGAFSLTAREIELLPIR